MDLPLPAAWGFGLLLLRTLGLLMTAPILGAKVVPGRVRLGLGLAIGAAVWLGAGAPTAAVPTSGFRLAAAAAGETALGLLAGFTARVVLDAALAAGEIMSMGAGLGFGSMVDPHSGAESNALSELLAVAAQGAAIALGIHREAVGWLARSAIAFPPGAAGGLRELAARCIWETTGAAALAVRLAFPVLAATMVGHLVLGALSRSAPQLGIGNVGFTISVMAGGGAFYLVAPGAAEIAARAALAVLAG